MRADGRADGQKDMTMRTRQNIKDRVIGDWLNARNMKSHSGTTVIRGACLRSSKGT